MPLSQINPTALKLLAVMANRAGSLPPWENASLKVTSMVLINLALLFPSRLLGFVTARAQVFFFSAICVFPPVIIHSMIPATAPWIVLSISTLSKLPGIHLHSYFASLLYHSVIRSLGLTSVLLHLTPHSTFHLTPVILSSQFSSEDSYIGILIVSSSESRIVGRFSQEYVWVSNPMDGNAFLITAPDCMFTRSAETKL